MTSAVPRGIAVRLSLSAAVRAAASSPAGSAGLMPTDVAMTLGFILHLFAAGLFTYGFLRAWGLGFAPSIIGGLAYMLGGPIASYPSPGHDGKLFVSALLPLGLPVLLVHGSRDVDVPPTQSRAYEAAARAAGDEVELVEVPDADHFDVVEVDHRAWLAVVERLPGLFDEGV